MNRTCNTCNIEKELTREFFHSLYIFNKNGEERFKLKCKACYKLANNPRHPSKIEYQKKYYLKNKQRLNAYRAEQYRKQKRQQKQNNNIDL